MPLSMRIKAQNGGLLSKRQIRQIQNFPLYGILPVIIIMRSLDSKLLAYNEAQQYNNHSNSNQTTCIQTHTHVHSVQEQKSLLQCYKQPKPMVFEATLNNYNFDRNQ